MLTDPRGRTSHEVDIVALSGQRVLALGEVILSEPLGSRHVDRLRHIRSLLGDRAADAKLLIVSGSGRFEPDAATAKDVTRVGLDQIYRL